MILILHGSLGGAGTSACPHGTDRPAGPRAEALCTGCPRRPLVAELSIALTGAAPHQPDLQGGQEAGAANCELAHLICRYFSHKVLLSSAEVFLHLLNGRYSFSSLFC